MYEYIKGKIVELSPAHIVIDCNGVGYVATISVSAYSAMLGKTDTKVYIHQSVREDAHTFFGFFSKEERELFRLLISVNGVGPSSAMLILSSGSSAEIKQNILTENALELKKVKGVGAKTAQRIIIDLKDKVSLADGEEIPQTQNSAAKQEALSALVMLGFNRLPAQKALDKILRENPTIELEKLIKEALKRL